MIKIISVVGARPNFIKIAPLQRAFLRIPGMENKLVHTGQHYDAAMSDIFFKELDIPTPDIHLNVGSGSHAVQTAEVMTKFETVLNEHRPDLVLVVGDVNSTLACSVTAAKMNIPTAHVEAGLRSFDRTMPEEVNRLVTDALSDYLFTTEASGTDNLLREGKSPDQVFFTGNVMIDSLMFGRAAIDRAAAAEKWDLKHGSYGLVTLHRPANVDVAENLERVVVLLERIQTMMPVIFPVHPRTRKNLEAFGLLSRLTKLSAVHLTDPLGYIDFVSLMKDAKMVLTDSGGLQEETTFLGVPCLTMRDNTERPVTATIGTNTLVGLNGGTVLPLLEDIVAGRYKKGSIPPLWDGRAADRIVKIIHQRLS